MSLRAAGAIIQRVCHQFPGKGAGQKGGSLVSTQAARTGRPRAADARSSDSTDGSQASEGSDGPAVSVEKRDAWGTSTRGRWHDIIGFGKVAGRGHA